MINNFFYLN